MSKDIELQAIYKKLWSFLKQMRHDSGLSQHALGRKLRKPQSWVFRTETGERRIDISEFIAWAVACGVDPVKAVKILATFL